MTTYALVHGAGDVGWYWHLVEPELRRLGHDVVVMELPVEDDAADLDDYADVVVDAIGDRRDVVIVGQSFGGYVAPLAGARVAARALVLVAGMIPAPGETANAMFVNTGWPGPLHDGDVFYNDVDPALAKQARAHGRRQSETPGKQPWPLAAWPDIPTHFVLCTDDHMFPARWLRRVVRDRLGIEPDELASGHTPALSHPHELVAQLARYS